MQRYSRWLSVRCATALVCTVVSMLTRAMCFVCMAAAMVSASAASSLSGPMRLRRRDTGERSSGGCAGHRSRRRTPGNTGSPTIGRRPARPTALSCASADAGRLSGEWAGRAGRVQHTRRPRRGRSATGRSARPGEPAHGVCRSGSTTGDGTGPRRWGWLTAATHRRAPAESCRELWLGRKGIVRSGRSANRKLLRPVSQIPCENAYFDQRKSLDSIRGFGIFHRRLLQCGTMAENHRAGVTPQDELVSLISKPPRKHET